MKTKFQDGGSSQEQQVAQLIQMYAQMTGMQPEDIVEKLKSLPQDQQQQALQSIAQEVQTAMAQQQGGAGQQMPMAQAGRQVGMNPMFSDLYTSSDKEDMLMNLFNSGQIPLSSLPQKLQGQQMMQQDSFNGMFSGAPDADGVYRNYAIGGEAFPQANTYPIDWASYSGNQYQKGRQTGNNTPNYEPNWFAKRTSVPGQMLGAVANFLPWFGSSMLSGGNDIINSYQGDQYYVPNSNVSYGDLSQYMINRKYSGMKPIPEYDAIIQGLTPEQLQQISGPMFKEGGEAFPQAQTYLPYDRPGETRPNFMFAEGGDTDDQWGGQPDINQIYNVMKRGGMAKDPKKKNGKDWDPNDFLSYMRSGGGLKKKVDIELPKHAMTGAVGNTPTTGKYKDPNAKSPWTYDYQNGKWTGYNNGKSYDISKYQSSVDILNKAYPDVVNPKTTTDPFDAGNLVGTTESKADEGFNTNPEGVDALVPPTADAANKESKNKNKVQPMKSLINGRDIITAAATQSKNKAGFLPALSAAVNTVGFFGDMAKGYGNLGRLAGMPFKSNKGYTPMGAAPAGYTDYNPPSTSASTMESAATPFQGMQSAAAKSMNANQLDPGSPTAGPRVPLTAPLMLPDDYPSPYEQFQQDINDPNNINYQFSERGDGSNRIKDPMSIEAYPLNFYEPINDNPYQRSYRKGGRIELPKKQMWKSQVSGSNFTPNASSYLMPQAGGMREDAIFDDWSSKNPMGTMDKFYSDNTAVDKDGNELYSYAPGSSADPNSPNFDSNTGKSEFNKDAGKKKFNLEYSSVEPERALAGLNSINRFITGINENKEAKANTWNMKGSERINPIQGGMDQGDYLTNSPQGNDFRVNEHIYAQDPGRGYNNQQLQNAGKSIYSKHGGSIWDRYKEDQEIDLDDLTLEDLRELYANGGTIEFLG